MKLITTFIITFIVVYILYLLTVILNKKKKNKILETNQAKLIIVPNKLDTKKINQKEFTHVISLANSFIVAVTFTISELFNNYIIKLLTSFVILIILILIIYKIIGTIYKKKEGNKNV